MKILNYLNLEKGSPALSSIFKKCKYVTGKHRYTYDLIWGAYLTPSEIKTLIKAECHSKRAFQEFYYAYHLDGLIKRNAGIKFWFEFSAPPDLVNREPYVIKTKR